MIISPYKLEDMRLRAALLEDMESLMKKGMISHAKEIGKITASLKKQIENPKTYERLDAYDRKMAELRRKTVDKYKS